MSPHSIAIRALIALACAAALCIAPAQAQRKEVKIGVIFDYTGPFAAGGSQAAALGTKIAIDMINERGGVEGYKIVPIYADAQSKAEVAINEAVVLAKRYATEDAARLVNGILGRVQREAVA